MLDAHIHNVHDRYSAIIIIIIIKLSIFYWYVSKDVHVQVSEVVRRRPTHELPGKMTMHVFSRPSHSSWWK